MKVSSKFLISGAAICALLLTACGGSGDSESASAPAEVKIPDAPDAAIETIAQELAKGNGGILWKAMPASYQTDVNGLAQLAGAKIDAEVYNQSFGLIGRLATIADKQKEFILNTQLGGPQPAEQTAKVEAAWPSIIGFFQTLSTSSIASVEGLQSFDGQSFFDSTVSSLIGYSEDLSALGGEELPLSAYRDVAVTVVESDESTAKLEMTAPDGEVTTEDFSKIEGRWVPTELSTDWSTQMADAKAQLEAITPEQFAQNKPQIMGMITMVSGILTQIENAETQEQFDQALQQAMMPLGMLMMQGMGGGMGAPAAPAMPVAPSAP